MTLLLANNVTNACTNFLITKGASTDGSTMISYAADSDDPFTLGGIHVIPYYAPEQEIEFGQMVREMFVPTESRTPYS